MQQLTCTSCGRTLPAALPVAHPRVAAATDDGRMVAVMGLVVAAALLAGLVAWLVSIGAFNAPPAW